MSSGRLVILLPLYNDWEPVRSLLDDLDRTLGGCGFEPEVLIVNDGSTEPLPPDLHTPRRTLRRVDVLHLRANIGHQRAIAVGLVHICRNRPGAGRSGDGCRRAGPRRGPAEATGAL